MSTSDLNTIYLKAHRERAARSAGSLASLRLETEDEQKAGADAHQDVVKSLSSGPPRKPLHPAELPGMRRRLHLRNITEDAAEEAPESAESDPKDEEAGASATEDGLASDRDGVQSDGPAGPDAQEPAGSDVQEPAGPDAQRPDAQGNAAQTSPVADGPVSIASQERGDTEPAAPLAERVASDETDAPSTADRWARSFVGGLSGDLRGLDDSTDGPNAEDGDKDQPWADMAPLASVAPDMAEAKAPDEAVPSIWDVPTASGSGLDDDPSHRDLGRSGGVGERPTELHEDGPGAVLEPTRDFGLDDFWVSNRKARDVQEPDWAPMQARPDHQPPAAAKAPPLVERAPSSDSINADPLSALDQTSLKPQTSLNPQTSLKPKAVGLGFSAYEDPQDDIPPMPTSFDDGDSILEGMVEPGRPPFVARNPSLPRRPIEQTSGRGHDRSSQRASVGSILRGARMAAGLDLVAVSDALRIRFKHLDALERGEHAGLPGKTYAVGFVRAYAEHLGLDPEELVRRFKAELGEPVAVSRPAPRPMSDLGFPNAREEARLPTGLTMIVFVLLILGGGAGWYFSRSPLPAVTDIVPAPPALSDPESQLLRPPPSVPTGGNRMFAPANFNGGRYARTAEGSDRLAPGQAPAQDPAADPSAPLAPRMASMDTVPANGAAAAGAETGGAVVSRPIVAPGARRLVVQPAADTALISPSPISPSPISPAAGASPSGTAAVAPAQDDVSSSRSSSGQARPEPDPSGPTQPEAAVTAAGPDGRSAPGRRSGAASDAQPASTTTAAATPSRPAAPMERVEILALRRAWMRIENAQGRVVVEDELVPGELMRVPSEAGLILKARDGGAFEMIVGGTPVGKAGRSGEALRGISLDPSQLKVQARGAGRER